MAGPRASAAALEEKCTEAVCGRRWIVFATQLATGTQNISEWATSDSVADRHQREILPVEKPPRNLLHLLCAIAVQKVRAQPDLEDVVKKTRDRLRVALRNSRCGDGLPQEGDVVEAFSG